ncbi:TRAP transporter substrate-binding protein DctP [Bacteriovoracaceae bacterium]|nr:TRAP transporter substrate-binding protein DctP [Bacteriovoracaceae bacterium]
MKYSYIFITLILSISMSVSAKTRKVKFGTLAPDGTPWADQLNLIKTQVEKESKNKIKVKVFLGGQLGGEREVIEKVRRGHIQGAGITMAAISNVIPELDVLEVPYLFESNEEVDYVLDKVLLPEISKLFDEKDLILVSLAENGWRSIGHKSILVKSPKDLKGQKMRSQESKVHLEFWKSMGASPVAISIPEVLTSLQTGMVKGYDNTPLFMVAAEWNTAIKNYSLTRHIYQAAAIIYSKKFWKKLTPEEQKILMGKGNELAKEVRASVRKLDVELIGVIKESGVKVHELSVKEKGEFSKLLSLKRKSIVKELGPRAEAFYQKVLTGKKKYKETKTKLK